MTANKPPDTGQRVLDAAERLLRAERAEFSMRELAAEAGLSFATPFNRFGSKANIMRALSDRRIDRMQERFDASPAGGDVTERVAVAIGIACAVMLEEPEVNHVVMGWLGAPNGEPGAVLSRSTAFWASALGDGDATLPTLLAIGFRGALSFWTAGELANDALEPAAHATAMALLAGWAGTIVSTRRTPRGKRIAPHDPA